MATIAENLQTIIDIKADIKTAIENKGVTVGDASFSEYAGKIDNIEGSGSTTIDVGALGLKFTNSTFTLVPSIFDFSTVTDMRYMFKNCSQLAYVTQTNTSNVTDMHCMFDGCSNLTSVPLFDTSNVTDMYYTFNGCSNLTSVPLFDTSNVTNMYGTFSGCSNLTSVPLFDTSNVTDMQELFRNCSNLTTIPQLNTSKVNSMRETFFNCKELITLPEFDCSGFNGRGQQGLNIVGDSLLPIQNIGGFKDLGKGFIENGYYSFISLNTLFELTYESCMNIINKVYDMNLNTKYNVNPRIIFSTASYDLLSEDDIAIATSKGWTIQRGGYDV